MQRWVFQITRTQIPTELEWRCLSDRTISDEFLTVVKNDLHSNNPLFRALGCRWCARLCKQVNYSAEMPCPFGEIILKKRSIYPTFYDINENKTTFIVRCDCLDGRNISKSLQKDIPPCLSKHIVSIDDPTSM